MLVAKVHVETTNTMKSTFRVENSYFDCDNGVVTIVGTEDEISDIVEKLLKEGILKKLEIVGKAYTKDDLRIV